MLSCNVYTGAFPIARALSQGAQIVVTGTLSNPRGAHASTPWTDFKITTLILTLIKGVL